MFECSEIFECMACGVALAYALLGTAMLFVAAIWIWLIVVKEYRAAGEVK